MKAEDAKAAETKLTAEHANAKAAEATLTAEDANVKAAEDRRSSEVFPMIR